MLNLEDNLFEFIVFTPILRSTYKRFYKKNNLKLKNPFLEVETFEQVNIFLNYYFWFFNNNFVIFNYDFKQILNL